MAFLYSERFGSWKSVIHVTLRSCTQPPHYHFPGSSSCHCVLSETQPDSEDEAANIHGQRFPPVSSFSYACLAASAARGFTSSVAFPFFRQSCRLQQPRLSFSMLPLAHPHILLFSPPSLRGRASFQLHPWWVHCWLVA